MAWGVLGGLLVAVLEFCLTAIQPLFEDVLPSLVFGLVALAAKTLRLLHSLSLKPEGVRLHQTASVPFCAMSEEALKRLDVLLRHITYGR